MIIVDENVEEYWIRLISSNGWPYYSIRDNCPGISDNEVIEVARRLGGLLITEDKDFGELIFSHKIDHVSVLFMRYDQPLYDQIEAFVVQCITDYFINPEPCFMTISKHKIRSRKF